MEVDPKRFGELVEQALDGLPADIGRMLDNVVVLVDDDSPPGPLFGLYEGVPLTGRGEYGGVLPDRVTLFRQTICSRCPDEAAVAEQVRVTVVHELGHHVGIDDERLHELGWG